MGGDFGPSVTLPAAISFLNREPDAELILVGQEDLLRAALRKYRKGDLSRLHIQHAAEVIPVP